VPFDGERTMKYLKQLCDLGSRVSGTEPMKKQQALLIKHFEAHGGKVTKQEFQAKQRSRRDPVGMTNLIASWYPDRKNRVILCAHYDTRPQADQEPDPRNWSRMFVSANDGTSGVAFLMEVAHHLKDLKTDIGIDLVLFDGEEYIFAGPDGGDLFFFGSEHFAAEYKANKNKLPYRYVAAVLFDLFAHENARLAVDGYSWQSSKDLVNEIWSIADQVKAKTFHYELGFKRGQFVQDDHVALQEVGIPAVDIIDFDYKHWHLLSDTPDKCSPKQMATVAQVIFNWLQLKK
jgi:Zn-dependent M28 family amino/carboxypeptidase